jgi:broad specificity phosphatase PhoE
MTTFYLARHGQADTPLADERRLRAGFRELVPLTPLGREQIERLAPLLRAAQAELIIASPIARALQSACILSRRLDLDVNVEFDLHEWIPDLSYSYDQSALSWANYQEMRALGGEWPPGETRDWEPLSSVRRRALGVLERYRHLHRVIVACHSGVILALTGQQLETGTHMVYEL